MKSLKLFLLMTLSSTLALCDDELVNFTFVGLNGGYALSESSKSGPVEPDFEIEDSGASYGFEIGYRASQSVFYAMNYSKYYFESRSFDNYYLSANYIFDLNKENFSLYVGALAGTSTILWREDPVVSMDTSNGRSSSYLVGAQVGFEYTVEEDFFLYYSYVYNYSPQDTLLYDTTTIDNDHRHSFSIGFRYYVTDENAGR